MNAILAEAESRAEQIRAEAVLAASEATDKANAEMKRFADAQARADDADAADMVARRKVSAGMDGKKALLAEKRALLSLVKSRLVERLYALEHKDYLHLVDIMLKTYAAEGDEVCIAKDCAITYGDVQSLDVCRALALKVVYDPSVKSGVLLKGRAIDKDLSFEALADSVFADHEMELADRLFGN